MKVAILIDGGFLKIKHRKTTGNFLKPNDVVDFCTKKIMFDPELDKDSLFRIYYYDCRPFNGKVKHPISKEKIDFSKKPANAALNNFYDTLAKKPKIAFRSGKLCHNGWGIPLAHAKKLNKEKSAPGPDDLKINLTQKKLI